jgi:hypothetical protein
MLQHIVGVFPCHQLCAQQMINIINVLLSTGAIYLDNGSGGKTLTVKGSVLYASTAGEQGGAIYMYSSNGAALITDNVFLDSSSTEVGACAAPLMLLTESCFMVFSVRLLFDLAVSLLLFPGSHVGFVQSFFSSKAWGGESESRTAHQQNAGRAVELKMVPH